MVDVSTKPSRRWRILLICSLTLNFAVMGVIVGALVSGRLGDGPPRSFDFGVGPVARALEPHERRAVAQALRQNRALRGVDFGARVDAITAVLRTEPFDPDALRGLLAVQSSQMADVQSKAQDALVLAIAAMTPERRAVFAEQVAEELAKSRVRGRRPSSGG